MGLPRVKESLCGCSVETGSKIVGWLCTIGRALHLISMIISCYQVSNLHNRRTTGSDHFEKALTILIVITVILGLYVIFDILLLSGIYKKRPSLMFPWIVAQIIGMIVTFLYLLRVPSNKLAETFGTLLVLNGINLYCVVIVNSHYQNLKSETPVTDNNPT